MIPPWFIGAVVVAAIGIYLDHSKTKGDTDGTDCKDGPNGTGDDRNRQQSPADSQHHRENLETSNGDVFELEKTQQGNDNEKVSSNDESISTMGIGDSRNDCGGEQSTST